MLENNFKLHEGESVIMYVRRHWIFLVVEAVKIFFLFLLPTVVIWVLQIFGFVPDFKIFGVTFLNLTDILIYMWGIVCWLMLAERFTDYSLDFWIVTNKRIVQSYLEKLFDRRLSTLELEDIEDIDIHNEGFWANYFGYGSLEVQTAGAHEFFKAEKVSNPENVQAVMFDAKLKDEQEKKDLERSSVENIAHKAVAEDLASHIPTDQKVSAQKSNPTTTVQTEAENFDWAHVSESQKADIRNLQAQIEEVEAKYKTGVDDALRTE